MNTDKREINQKKEDKIIAFRPRVSNFNELVNNISTQGGLINYVAAKTGVDKAYVASYVAEVYSRIDDGRDNEEDEFTIEDFDRMPEDIEGVEGE